MPENPDENFVRAYVMIADRGQETYASLGHAFLRMCCPSHKLDYVFSCEGEDAANQYLDFFLGRLQMGVRAVPTKEYLKQYKDLNRKVDQYELQLPIHVKQRLWKQLDQHIMEPNVPYDYIERGCATCTMQWIEDAADPDSLVVERWPGNIQRTPAETGYESVTSKWKHLVLNFFTAGKADKWNIPNTKKIVAPIQLVYILSNTTYNGKPILVAADSIRANLPADYYDEWTPTLSPLKTTLKNLFTQPMMVALICLFVALLGVRLKKMWVVLPVLILGGLISLFITYLVVLQPIPNNEWNWLLVPFNILPFCLWHWRDRWAKWYMTLTAIWAVGMLLAPHFLVDPALIVLALAQAAAVLPLRKEERQRMK